MAHLYIFHLRQAFLIGSILLCKSQAFITKSPLSYRFKLYPFKNTISSSSSSAGIAHSPGRRYSLSFPPATMASSHGDDDHQIYEKNQSFLRNTDADDNSNTAHDDSLVEGILMKVGMSTSKVVSGIFFVALAYERNAIMLAFFIGAIGNSILSKVLKKVLNQDRPMEYLTNENIKEKPGDKGMPSSHAMSLGFIGTFTYLLSMTSNTYPLLVAFILIPYIYISLWYRIKGGLHTLDQIIVGITIGSSNGWLWHSLVMGNNLFFPNVNILNLVEDYLLPQSGVFPITYLIIPAFVGVTVVGSFERRLSKFLKTKYGTNKQQ